MSFQYFLAADGEGLCEGLPFLILLLSHSVQPVVCLPRSTVVLGLGWASLPCPGPEAASDSKWMLRTYLWKEGVSFLDGRSGFTDSPS